MREKERYNIMFFTNNRRSRYGGRPSKKRGRRAGTWAAAAAVVVAVATAAFVPLAAPVGADHVPTHPPEPVMEGPYTVGWSSGSSFSYTYQQGTDAQCGPEASGDGWHCPVPHRPQEVRFNARAPGYVGANVTYDRMTVRLYLGFTLVAERSEPCRARSNWCTPSNAPKPFPASDYWTLYQGVERGWLSARIVLDYHNYLTGAPGTWDSGEIWLNRQTGLYFTAADIPNNPPDVSYLAFPSDSHPDLHRGQAEHLQQFTGGFYDNDGHNISARLRVYGPGPTVDCDSPPGPAVAAFDWAKQKAVPRPPYPLDWAYAGAYPVGLTTPPLALPHANGTYTACLDATDTSGWANAQGPTRAFTFNYTWNTAPIDPLHVVPNGDPNAEPNGPGKVFPAGVPVAFVAKALDAENDALTMVTTINDGTKQYRSIPTSSGRETVTIIEDGLPVGEDNFAKVAGEDIHGQQGVFGSRVSFRVVDPAAMSNRPPGVPTLVAPVEDGVFPAGVPQDFTVAASDPDGHRWRGVVQVQDREGVTVAEFATDETASGQAVSARPLVPIRPGTGYRWRATALDSRGALGSASDWRYFAVQDG